MYPEFLYCLFNGGFWGRTILGMGSKEVIERHKRAGTKRKWKKRLLKCRQKYVKERSRRQGSLSFNNLPSFLRYRVF